MLFSHSKTYVPSSSPNVLPGKFSPSKLGYVVECTQVQPITAPLNCRVALVEHVSSLKSVSFFKRPHSSKALHVNFNLEDPIHVSGFLEQKLHTNYLKKQTASREIIFDSRSDSESTLGVVDHTEIQRGRRIGHANKGNVPWNKGIKHSTETRKLISQRTAEALSDPKVRKRMSGLRRPHSNQTKAQIGASQRRLWEERLKLKRLREEYYLLWADNIAKAAKKGGLDQKKLEWDCYERLKSKQLKQQAAAKAKRAKRKARAEAERMARLAQKRKALEERAKISGEVKRRRKRSPEEKEELAAARELKLKERLAKIVKKKLIKARVGGQNPRAWETLDLDFINKGRKLFENSLADRTRAIKSRSAESASMATCVVYPSSERAPE